MKEPIVIGTRGTDRAVGSSLAPEAVKVLRNTYALLALSVLVSAGTATASVALKLPHPGLLITLVVAVARRPIFVIVGQAVATGGFLFLIDISDGRLHWFVPLALPWQFFLNGFIHSDWASIQYSYYLWLGCCNTGFR